MERNVTKYWILMLFGLFVLTGCSTTPRQTPDTTTGSSSYKNKNWKARQAKLSALAAWKLKGRASVAYHGDNWPFGLEWQQSSPRHYTMNINHPLTQSSLAQIMKTDSVVSLVSNGRKYQDSSAERLIEKNLRIKLPVKGMRHWVLGIVSPHYPAATVKLDSAGRPISLQQAGWNIHYSKYQSNTFDALPSLINVTRKSPQSVQIKMRIRQWN